MERGSRGGQERAALVGESNGLLTEARIDRDSPPSPKATVGNLRLNHERRLVEAPGFGLVEHSSCQ